MRSRASRRLCSPSESLKTGVFHRCLLILLCFFATGFVNTDLVFVAFYNIQSKVLKKSEMRQHFFFVHFFPLRAVHVGIFVGYLGNYRGVKFDWLHSPIDY